MGVEIPTDEAEEFGDAVTPCEGVGVEIAIEARVIAWLASRLARAWE